MTYCTSTELGYITGSDLSSTILWQIITLADLEIDAVLRANGIQSANTNDLKAASLKLSTAGVVTRHRMDGTMPKRTKIGDLELESEPSQAIERLRADAYEILRGIVAASRSYRNIIRKVNS